MAVEAVNGVEPQKRQHSVGAAIGTGVVTGLAGAGAGYLWGGGKYVPTMKEMLDKDEVEFSSAMKKAEEAKKDAADIQAVKDARTSYLSATEEAERNLVLAETKYNGYVNGIADDASEEIKTANSELKTAQDAKREVTVYDDNGVAKKSGENVVKEELTATQMKDKVQQLEQQVVVEKVAGNSAKAADLQKNLEAVKAEYKAELDALEKAEKGVYSAKETVFLASEAAKDEAKDECKAVKDLAAKKSALEDAKTNAMKNVSEDATKAFDKIKNVFKEIKGGKLALWAGIAAVVGLIAGYALSGKPAEAPQETQA